MYRELLRYMATMYEEGLISREIITISTEMIIADAASDKYGVYIGVNSQVAGAYEQDFEGIPHALTGPTGIQMYSAAGARVYGAGHFSITTKNPYPAETLEWIDYFYSDEGSELLLLGIKDWSYSTDADGNNYFLDWVMNDPQGRTFDEVVGTFTSWGGGGNPVVLLGNTFLGGEAHPIPRAAANAMMPYLPKETWEAFRFSEEQSEIISRVGNDINPFHEEMRALFVTGKLSLDSDWDNYISEYQKMQVDDYIAAHQEAYEASLVN